MILFSVLYVCFYMVWRGKRGMNRVVERGVWEVGDGGGKG